MPKSFYNFESTHINQLEINFIQNLIDVHDVDVNVEKEIPIHELRIMEKQFEEYWMEREAI